MAPTNCWEKHGKHSLFDNIGFGEHHKTLSNQKKYDAQLKAAQQSAGQQIDNRVDQSLSGLDAKVKVSSNILSRVLLSKRRLWNLTSHFLNVNLLQQKLMFVSFLALHPHFQHLKDTTGTYWATQFCYSS